MVPGRGANHTPKGAGKPAMGLNRGPETARVSRHGSLHAATAPFKPLLQSFITRHFAVIICRHLCDTVDQRKSASGQAERIEPFRPLNFNPSESLTPTQTRDRIESELLMTSTGTSSHETRPQGENSSRRCFPEAERTKTFHPPNLMDPLWTHFAGEECSSQTRSDANTRATAVDVVSQHPAIDVVSPARSRRVQPRFGACTPTAPRLTQTAEEHTNKGCGRRSVTSPPVLMSGCGRRSVTSPPLEKTQIGVRAKVGDQPPYSGFGVRAKVGDQPPVIENINRGAGEGR